MIPSASKAWGFKVFLKNIIAITPRNKVFLTSESGLDVYIDRTELWPPHDDFGPGVPTQWDLSVMMPLFDQAISEETHISNSCNQSICVSDRNQIIFNFFETLYSNGSNVNVPIWRFILQNWDICRCLQPIKFFIAKQAHAILLGHCQVSFQFRLLNIFLWSFSIFKI